jgi:hypothetical protein
MATIGDFQGQAGGFYAGQKEADRIKRQGDVNTAKSKVESVDPYYSQLFEDLNQNQGKAQGNLVSSMARRGLTRSGIRTNAESNLGAEYGKMGERLGTEQRTVKGEAENTYNQANSLLGNLDLEYQGKVNELANELFNNWQTQETAKVAATSKGYGTGTDTGGYKNKNIARTNYNADLDYVESQLRQFQANGYQGNLPSKSAMKAQLVQEYDGWVSPEEIDGYINTLYSRYYLS